MRASDPALLVHWIAFCAVVVACAPPQTAPTIEISCENLARPPLGPDGLGARAGEPLPIAVGDKVRCAITLRRVPSDPGRDDTPPVVFNASEWAFESRDGGLIHPEARKRITGWFGGDAGNIVPEQGTDLLKTACEGPGRRRKASPVELSECDVLCCGTLPHDPNDWRHELLTRRECVRRSGTELEIDWCSDANSIACHLEYDYPEDAEQRILGFIPGRCQVTEVATCLAAGDTHYGGRIESCQCCQMPTGELHSEPYGYDAEETPCDDTGGVAVDPQRCWSNFEPCGWDQVCSVGFCTSPAAETRLNNEAECGRVGGQMSVELGDQTATCCSDDNTGELFLVAAPIRTKERWQGTTSEVFTALAEGTVTLSMRQTQALPLAFNEAKRGASRVTLTIHAVRPSPCQADADCVDDGNPCSLERCVANLCETHVMGDGVACTWPGSCAAGTCVAGSCETPLETDGNACEDDGDPCSESECVAGACAVVLDLCACTSDDDCLSDPRDDGDLCTGRYRCSAGRCSFDAGSPIVCDHGQDTDCRQNRCARRAGDSGSCAMTPVREGEVCEADMCTTSGQCRDGECTGGLDAPKDCDDSNACTVDSCDPVSGACINVSDGKDGFAAVSHSYLFAASTDTSRYEALSAASPRFDRLTVMVRATAPGDYPIGASAADRNTATCTTCVGLSAGCDADGCDAELFATSGMVRVTAVVGARGIFVGTLRDATFAEVAIDPVTRVSTPIPGGASRCVASLALQGSEVCPPACAPGACDVDDGCGGLCACAVDFVCVAQLGMCRFDCSNPTRCDDDNVCTEDSCSAELGCVHTSNSAACSDGNACTTDSCHPATGCTTTPTVCDDGNACTTNSCDPATGCTTTPACADSDPFTSDSCDPSNGNCTHTRVGLVATAGVERVTLTWPAIAGATSYNVYLGFAPGVTATTGSAINGAVSPEVVPGLAPGLPVYVVLTAVTGAGESARSGEATATPLGRVDTTAPFVVGTIPLADDRGVDPGAPITVRFSEPLDPRTLATGFSVIGLSGPVSGASVQTGATVVFTPNAPLAPSGSYTVSLGSGIGDLADLAGNALVPAHSFAFTTRPVAPLNTTAIEGKGAVTLTWDAVVGATGYAIQRAATPGGPYQPQGGTVRNSYTDRTVADDSTYYYRVTAFTAAGESGSSGEFSATPSSLGLPAPANVIALPGNSEALIAWDTSGVDCTYTVLRATSPTGALAPIATNLSSVTFRDTGLGNPSDGTRYHYVVQAHHGPSSSPWSREADVIPRADLPAAPSGLTATVGSGWVELAWGAVAGASAYVVYAVADDPADAAGHEQRPAVVGASGTNRALVELADGASYYVQVAALDASGSPGVPSTLLQVSPSVTLPPRPTEIVAAYASEHGTIHLDWTRAPGATGYVVSRASFQGGPYSEAGETSATSFDDVGLAAGPWFYVVAPTSNGGAASAGDSDEVMATATSGAAAVPDNVVAQVSDGCVMVSWDPVAGMSGYELRYGTTSGGPYDAAVSIASGFDNAFSLCNLANGTPYYFVVASLLHGQRSDLADEVAATPLGSLPGQAVITSTLAGRGQVLVQWDPAPRATGYHVQRRTDHSPWEMLAPTSSELSFRDHGVVDEIAYYYRVESDDGVHRGAYSSATSAVIPSAARLVAPTPVVAQAASSCVTLSWDPVPGMAQYQLMYAEASGGPYTNVRQTADGFDNRYTFCGLDNCDPASPGPCTSYHFVVQSVFASQVSIYSDEVSATPSASLPAEPSLLPDSCLGCPSPSGSQVTLQWAAAEGATSYRVHRRTAQSPWEELSPAPAASALSYVDRSVVDETPYLYRLEAADGAGRGAFSAPTVAITPSAALPSAPSANLSAQPGDECVSLFWDVVPGVSHYRVLRATASGGPYNFVLPTDDGFDNRATYCGLDPTPHYFVIQSVSGNDYSGFSRELSATPASTLPGRAQFASISPGRGQVVLQWSAADRTTRYHLERRTDRTPWQELTPATSALSYIDRSVVDGTTYYYALQGENGSGRGATSGSVAALPSATLPTPPSINLWAQPGDACVTLSWDPVPGVSSYRLAQGDRSGGPYSPAITTLDSFDNRVTYCGLDNEVPHYFVIESLAADSSGYSSELTATPSEALPATPTDLVASAGGVGVLELAWTPVEGALGYRILRRAASSTWVTVGQSNSPTYTDRGLGSGSEYSYTVMAFSALGAGAQSESPFSAVAP